MSANILSVSLLLHVLITDLGITVGGREDV